MGTKDKHSGSGGFLRAVLFLVLSLVVIAAAVLAYIKSRDMDLENMEFKEVFGGLFSGTEPIEEESDEVSIDFDVTNDTYLGTCREYVVIYRNGEIAGYDLSGRKEWKIQKEMYQPYAQGSGQYLVVADLNGKAVCAVKGRQLLWEKDLESSALNAYINKSGYVSINTSAKGYSARVLVFDPYGVEIFRRNYAGRYVLASAVSPEKREVLINMVDTEGVKAQTVMEFTDLMGNFIAGINPDTDCILPCARYVGQGCLALAGPCAVAAFDVNKKMMWRKEFPLVYGFTAVDGELIAAAVAERDTRGTNVRINVYLCSGKTVWSYDLDDRVAGMDSYEEIIAVNTGREVLFIRDGKLFDRYSCMCDIIGISIINRKKAAVITRKGIMIHDINSGLSQAGQMRGAFE